MLIKYSSGDAGALLMLLTAPFTLFFMGLMVACVVRSKLKGSDFPWKQIFEVLMVALSADTLRWDLMHTEQYPLKQRIILTVIAMVFGIVAYVKKFINKD
jgi:ABC-type sugar transport system permease subunit